MPREKKKTAALFDEKTLSKAQLRKLKAVRKGMTKLLGDELGRQQADKAFADWLVQNPSGAASATDADAAKIAETLWPLVEKKQLHIGRSGYIVKRGRGRLLVKAVKD